MKIVVVKAEEEEDAGVGGMEMLPHLLQCAGQHQESKCHEAQLSTVQRLTTLGID